MELVFKLRSLYPFVPCGQPRKTQGIALESNLVYVE